MTHAVSFPPTLTVGIAAGTLGFWDRKYHKLPILFQDRTWHLLFNRFRATGSTSNAIWRPTVKNRV